MTKFAINYSPEAAGLVDAGLIDVDLYKCPVESDPVVVDHRPNLLDEARAVRPIYIHFPIDACSTDDVDWAEVDHALSTTETAHVNVHLAARSTDFPDIAPASVEDRADSTEIVAFHTGVSPVVDRYGAEKVIVKNNNNIGPEGRFLRAGTDPGLITALVRSTGCGLLLDLAHARLTCDSLSIDPIDYVSKMPVDRLRELHVTGTGTGERLRDSMPMNDVDWRLLEWASREIKSGAWSTPSIVAFEYGGIGPLFDWRSDPEVIARQLPKLRAVFR